jgi:hypothetical protein
LQTFVRRSQESDSIMSDTEIPTQFSHSVKIEQSAKGARVTVHVNANNDTDAMVQSINLYRITRRQLESADEMVAPIEVKAIA